MLHLLRLEWKKLVTNRLFLVTVALYLVLLPLLYRTVQSSSNGGDGTNNPMVSIYKSLYQFPGIWDVTTYLGSWLTFFLLTYLVLFSITSETANKTLRQNLITGMSRNQWLTGKLLLLLVLAFGAVLYTTLVTLIFGYAAGGYGKPFSDEALALGRFFLQSVFYGSFALLLALVFRRGGLALMVFFAYTLIIERIIRYLVFGELLGDLALGNWLPANLAWDTVPFYLAKRIPDALSNESQAVLMDANTATLGMLGYTVVFLGLSYWMFNRRDL